MLDTRCMMWYLRYYVWYVIGDMGYVIFEMRYVMDNMWDVILYMWDVIQYVIFDMRNIQHTYCSYCVVTALAVGRVFECIDCQSFTSSLPRTCGIIEDFVRELSPWFPAFSFPSDASLQDRRDTVERYRTGQVRHCFQIPRMQDVIVTEGGSVGPSSN